MSLRRRMADFGFESNDDYEYPMRALFAARIEHLRCLQVAGESGRRKTAFANALAHSLDYPHVIYHDFSLPEPPPTPIIVTAEDKENPEPVEASLTRFERSMVEACAYSEASKTALILDQLQVADFRDQLRLQQFIVTREWSVPQGLVKANAKHLLIMLISETPLYHSLARVSYRVWTDASGGRFEFRPVDVGLGLEAQPLFDLLAQLFDQLGTVPTPTEFRHIVDDLLAQVRTEDQLRQTLFGWMERIDRALLYSNALLPLVRDVVRELNAMLGLEEVVITGGDLSGA
jgi:hypothetical protein